MQGNAIRSELTPLEDKYGQEKTPLEDKYGQDRLLWPESICLSSKGE